MSINYVESLDIFGVPIKEIPCITKSGRPTKSTVGAVGLFYMDTDTGLVYKCTLVDNGVYTWTDIATSGGSAGTSSGSVISVDVLKALYDMLSVTAFDSSLMSTTEYANNLAILAQAIQDTEEREEITDNEIEIEYINGVANISNLASLNISYSGTTAVIGG